ncbi:Major facilitator superfamily domaingeneral substrate transporter [Penicillium lividum]|nr:Major facilitator superfamily domaingeneral substrate transporter [Penicillium lividum]
MNNEKEVKQTLDIEQISSGVLIGAVGDSPSSMEHFEEMKRHKRAILAVPNVKIDADARKAFACSTTPILIGYDLTLIGSIIANSQFVEQFGVYDQALESYTLPAGHQPVWTIVQYCSAIASAMGSGILIDMLGRRICFLITVGLTIIGTLVELFSPN